MVPKRDEEADLVQDVVVLEKRVIPKKNVQIVQKKESEAIRASEEVFLVQEGGADHVIEVAEVAQESIEIAAVPLVLDPVDLTEGLHPIDDDVPDQPIEDVHAEVDPEAVVQFRIPQDEDGLTEVGPDRVLDMEEHLQSVADARLMIGHLKNRNV